MAVLSLLFLAALIFVLANLVLMPLWLSATSLAGSYSAPGRLLKVVSSRRLRQNHALEHATLNVLEERLGPRPLAGLAREDGFVLKGLADPETVRAAAEEGLARLKRGERALAYHRRCGTSRAVANLVTSVAFLVLLLGLGRFSLPYVVGAMVAANLGGPVFGRLVQGLLTTAPDVRGLAVAGVEYGVAQGGWALLLADPVRAGVPVVCFVRTAAGGVRTPGQAKTAASGANGGGTPEAGGPSGGRR